MTVSAALSWATLELSGLPSPLNDAELLLMKVLQSARTELYSNGSDLFDGDDLKRFREMVARRALMEPLQYITGIQAFRRIELEVGPGVLVPRQETELLVERALGLISGIEKPIVVEIGAGSGAIALSIALERPGALVYATEISIEAIGWAGKNQSRRDLRNVTILEGDLFSPLPDELKGSVDLVVSNPPYLSEAEIASAPADVREHEPRVATVSGESGLEVSSAIAAEALVWLRAGAWLLLETGPPAAEKLRQLLSESYTDVAIDGDLSELMRIAAGRKP